MVNHGSAPLGDGYLAMTWPTEFLIACTWNVELSLEMGRGVGEDGLYAGVAGWYGPAVNIHRTPFAGRNFEYYSEDSFLSGVMGKAAIQGAAQKGMYAFLKHYALNDQEIHRDHLGLITWAGEQAIREIYLRPFEICLKDNNVEISTTSRSAAKTTRSPATPKRRRPSPRRRPSCPRSTASGPPGRAATTT